eukprot:TRINITY_DN41498_c0_g1_i1.p1 TRINITY_DN41498_c0_g1~~TRINITY_DN41498_c0_g1_i1.p1  ORF type:complete len:404 (+),score=43.12 TRINITY_DN41498_c0_g1_i1:94-1305(+)
MSFGQRGVASDHPLQPRGVFSWLRFLPQVMRAAWQSIRGLASRVLPSLVTPPPQGQEQPVQHDAADVGEDATGRRPAADVPFHEEGHEEKPMPGQPSTAAQMLEQHAVVVMSGLTSETGKLLNGRLGKVVAIQEESERAAVQLQSLHGVQETKRVLPKNLRRVDMPVQIPLPASLSASSRLGDGSCSSSSSQPIAVLEEAQVIREVMEFLDATSLCEVRAAGRQGFHWDLRFACTAWKGLCKHLLASRAPRFHLTEERAANLNEQFPRVRWFHLYHHLLAGARDPIHPRELADLQWAFNFSGPAGGRGLLTAQIVRFEPSIYDESRCTKTGYMHLENYPPLPYELQVSQGGASSLQIANFPIHPVERLPSWEWRISNANVVLVSGMGCESVQSFHDRVLVAVV